MTADEKAIGKAEAQVIIAYHYSQMLRYYGGMPWIDHAYTAEDAMKFPRMTVEENRTENHRVAGCRRLCITLAGRCG